MKTYHIPIFVPHKGCPHDCVFCNQRHITGTVRETTPEDVKRIIHEHIGTISGDYYAEAAFFGGSFTGIDINKQTELMEAAYPFIANGKLHGLRCSTRPDCITDEILKNLKKYKMRCIELGVQSTDSKVLVNSNRGHTFEDVVNATRLIKSYEIDLGVQMMLGLPGDDIDKMIKTAEDLISLEPSCVRIYPTLVVKDTALYHMYQRGVYTPLELDFCVEVLATLIPMFERAGVSVIRVGLQTTDDINADTVYGPYHPSVRELAENRIIRNILENHIQPNSTVLEVDASPCNVSKIVGQNKSNKEFFKSKYGLELKVKVNPNIDADKLKIYDKIVEIY